MKIEMVFENSNFIVVDKPSGVLTTPSRIPEMDERLCLGVELQRQMGVQIYPVHRLDAEVSGLVLFAKNEEAHRTANEWFEKRLVSKTYEAITGNQNFSHLPISIKFPRQAINFDKQKDFIWTCKILRGKKRSFESVAGKPSETHASFIGLLSPGRLYWQLKPVTGRPHQLRFELSRHGFPIIGDHLYGSQEVYELGGIALRSWQLDFTACKDRLGLPDLIGLESMIHEKRLALIHQVDPPQ